MDNSVWQDVQQEARSKEEQIETVFSRLPCSPIIVRGMSFVFGQMQVIEAGDRLSVKPEGTLPPKEPA